MYPSVKRIASMLNLDTATARKVRGLMDGTIDPYTVEGMEDWRRQLYSQPARSHAKIEAIDRVLETCGVEGWADPTDYRHGVSYCNTGDTYAATICLITDDRGTRWYLGSWGDLAERNVCHASEA
jgi:hypothetical protein